MRVSGNALLALPRNNDARAEFLENFLGGAWIRHYAFANNDVAALYYCLQPGRFGAMYMDPQRRVMSTVVLDIAALLAGTDITVNAPKSASGCMSFPGDTDCTAIFDRLGLAFDGKPSAGQKWVRAE